MSILTRSTITALAGLGAVAAGLAVPAAAAQSTDTLDCAGHQLTIRANESNSSDRGGWSTVQVVEGGSGHLTPVAFSGVLTDTATDTVLGEFHAARGTGKIPKGADPVDCTVRWQATVADFAEDVEELPPGTSLSDPVVFDFVATVLVKD